MPNNPTKPSMLQRSPYEVKADTGFWRVCRDWGSAVEHIYLHEKDAISACNLANAAHNAALDAVNEATNAYAKRYYCEHGITAMRSLDGSNIWRIMPDDIATVFTGDTFTDALQAANDEGEQ